MRRGLATGLMVLIAVGLAPSGIAAEKAHDVSVAAIQGPEAVKASNRLSEFWTFEANEGFSPGYVNSQAGWAAYPASLTEPHIDTANPFAGSQHLRISYDPAIPPGSTIGALSPGVVDTVADPSSVTVSVAIGATGGPDYNLVAQAPSLAMVTARVEFSSTGDIQVVDDLGGGPVLVDSGTDWVVGSYNLLEIHIDPGLDTIDYHYMGSLIYTTVGGVFAAPVIEEVVIFRENRNSSESGDFDDLTIDRGTVPVELQSFQID